jgi:hypothetical protein
MHGIATAFCDFRVIDSELILGEPGVGSGARRTVLERPGFDCDGLLVRCQLALRQLVEHVERALAAKVNP